MFRFFLILFCFCSNFIFTSCSLYKKEFVYVVDPKDKEKQKPIEIILENIPNSIVYYSPVQTEYPEAKNNLFLAKGLGGLGGVLDGQSNQLIPFNGIKITFSAPVSSDKIHVDVQATDVSDKLGICSNLFYYNSKASSIDIRNIGRIDTLVECNLNVKITAKNDADVSSTYTNTFPITFNLTLKDYANKNDPLVLALMNENKFENINQLIAWLTRCENSCHLKINHNDFTDRIQNANALTGLAHVIALDLSNAKLNSTRALVYLKKLEILNLANTSVNSEELLNLSKNYSILNLNVSNLNLRDLTFLENGFKNLSSLDLSNNPNLFIHLASTDVQKISHLHSLNSLNLSNTGLLGFQQLNQLTNLHDTMANLNVSKNDLSRLDNSDKDFLKNLTHLESLNVSESNMPVWFLNDYFEFLQKTTKPLKSFIYRGRFLAGKSAKDQKPCDQTSDAFTMSIQSLILSPYIENINFHGQGCFDTSGAAHGLINTAIFERVEDLINLDISSTPVSDFSGLKNLEKLKTLKIVDTEKNGISMTRAGCLMSQKAIIPKVSVDSCELLSSPNKLSRTFEFSGETVQTFVIPKNVWQITISGCSGANGGSGGGASGSLAMLHSDIYPNYYGVFGGNSGAVNNNSNSFTIGHPTPFLGDYLFEEIKQMPWIKIPAYPDQNGKNGGVGLRSSVKTNNGISIVDFSTAQPSTSEKKCFAGVNGEGGESIVFLEKPDPSVAEILNKVKSGAGAKNKYQPWSSPIETYENIQVQPGQILNIFIGSGGVGGNPGTPQLIPLERGNARSLHKRYGNPGQPGTAGANGFITIEWEPGVTDY